MATHPFIEHIPNERRRPARTDLCPRHRIAGGRMSRRRRTGVGRFLPWSGIIGGFAGIAVVHQWGSTGLFNDCARYSPAVMAAVLGLGLLCIGIGAMGSIGVAYHSHETPERRFISLVSLGCAILFVVAVLLPGTAGSINPICGG